MPKIYKYRELLARLKKHDKRFVEYLDRGKGSERIIYHPDIKGRAESFPIKCHGEGKDVRPGVVSAIKRRFDIPDNVL